jgi:hypothetical protein
MRYSDIIKKSPLWFRHESPLALKVLRPLTYEELRQARPGYDVDARMETELPYKDLVSSDPNISFLYATICGFNKMESAESYPGYTYYFRLSRKQIEQCLFGVVDKELNMVPVKGVAGLREAMGFWAENSNAMSMYMDPELGPIDPRVEVIIPFAVHPERYVPQQEDR